MQKDQEFNFVTIKHLEVWMIRVSYFETLRVEVADGETKWDEFALYFEWTFEKDRIREAMNINVENLLEDK